MELPKIVDIGAILANTVIVNKMGIKAIYSTIYEKNNDILCSFD
tara:strand:- start:103 stop:234 length:132 start_codon:yes stop_codon:yes gene_type:complete